MSLLDADPAFAADLRPGERPLAGAALMCEVTWLTPGTWAGVYPGVAPDSVRLGGLVVDGLLVREMSVAGRPSGELLGGGDVLLPLGADEQTFVTRSSRWRVLTPVQVAVLGPTVAAGLVRWPSIGRTLGARSERRVARVLAMQSLAHLPRASDRLLGILWLLAERWGRVRGDGVLLPLALTHRTLGHLAGIHRQSATEALRRLEEDRCVLRSRDRLVLCGRAPDFLHDPPTGPERAEGRSADGALG